MASHGEDSVYHPRDAVAGGVAGALVVGSAGVIASAVKLALQPRNMGAWGIFRHTGGTSGLFGMYRTPSVIEDLTDLPQLLLVASTNSQRMLPPICERETIITILLLVASWQAL